MRHATFVGRQVLLVGMAVFSYFWVRGQTEGGVVEAKRNAEQILAFERHIGLNLEYGLQNAVQQHELLVDLANWIYIWAHWPLVIASLVWLAVTRREEFEELRNALFFSGAIGLVIYVSYAAAPPRLFDPSYVDTVTDRSSSYRVLQPPGLVNRYAAMPSLHFGWNLLVGMYWHRLANGLALSIAGRVMPVAMGFAVVATANHWTLDVVVGGAVALSGLGVEKLRQQAVGSSRAQVADRRPEESPAPEGPEPLVDLRSSPSRPLDHDGQLPVLEPGPHDAG